MEVVSVLNEYYGTRQRTDENYKEQLMFHTILERCEGEKFLKLENAFQREIADKDVCLLTGNCSVARGVWNRNDFPFWLYFQEGASASLLNEWKGNGREPAISDDQIQCSLGMVLPGKMAVILPNSLAQEMERNPEVERHTLRKVDLWKKNYDIEDNAVAASYGFNVTSFQESKSYCIALDRDANILHYAVIGDGLERGEGKEKSIFGMSRNYLLNKNSYDVEEDNLMSVDRMRYMPTAPAMELAARHQQRDLSGSEKEV